MEQIRFRLGDILDDYCPRERRITNHAIVAMVESEVKKTRCTTCDAEHDYRDAQIRPKRMKKARLVSRDGTKEVPVTGSADSRERVGGSTGRSEVPDTSLGNVDSDPAVVGPDFVNEGVRRSLIRATLQRPNGQSSTRQARDFKVRGAAGRSNGRYNNDWRSGLHGNRQGDTNGNRNPVARSVWQGEVTNSRSMPSRHTKHRSQVDSSVAARRTDGAWSARHGKKRSK